MEILVQKAMRVLVADDDRIAAEILSRTLTRWKFDVTVVADGAEAWDYLQSATTPTLAILDWMMPHVDGAEICRLVRQRLPLANLYLILLTSLEGQRDIIAGLDAGADDYLIKPFDPDVLRARVQVGERVLTLQGRLADRVAELQSARDEFARLASTDALTSLNSRRQWFELATTEFGRSRRYQSPLGLLMSDLDLFKRVNDTFGHDTGDEVLKHFADVLRLQTRHSDVAGRVGGEEFAVLLPETSIGAAQEVGKRIVERCRAIAIPTAAGLVTFSCSVGVTGATPTDHTIEEMLRRADKALYQAKRSGRDCVHVLGVDDTPARAGAAAASES